MPQFQSLFALIGFTDGSCPSLPLPRTVTLVPEAVARRYPSRSRPGTSVCCTKSLASPSTTQVSFDPRQFVRRYDGMTLVRSSAAGLFFLRLNHAGHDADVAALPVALGDFAGIALHKAAGLRRVGIWLPLYAAERDQPAFISPGAGSSWNGIDSSWIVSDGSCGLQIVARRR